MSKSLPEDWNPEKPAYVSLMSNGWRCIEHAVDGRSMYQTWVKDSPDATDERKWFKLIQFRWDNDEGWVLAFESDSLRPLVAEDSL